MTKIGGRCYVTTYSGAIRVSSAVVAVKIFVYYGDD